MEEGLPQIAKAQPVSKNSRFEPRWEACRRAQGARRNRFKKQKVQTLELGAEACCRVQGARRKVQQVLKNRRFGPGRRLAARRKAQGGARRKAQTEAMIKVKHSD